jgi:hypothetical protein
MAPDEAPPPLRSADPAASAMLVPRTALSFIAGDTDMGVEGTCRSSIAL